MTDLLDRVEKSILARGLLQPRQSLVAAVSGGMDSMVLLHILHHLARRHDWHLTVAHFNHRLRGRSSDADERLVRKQAEKFGLACLVESADVKACARQHRLSLEMAARRLRHEFFVRACRASRSTKVVLAHHADDQVELFFLRLLRGAGTEGLAGMKWRNASPSDPRIELTRPLLDCAKEDLRQFARRERIPFREDASNLGLDMLRNRIRHELLPLIKKSYQPGVARTVPRLMDILGEEAELFTQKARGWLKAGRPAFERLSPALQRRVVQLQLLENSWPADFELVERLRAEPEAPFSLSPRLQVYRDSAGLLHTREGVPESFHAARLRLNLKGRRRKARFEGLTLAWRIQPAAGLKRRFRTRPGQEWFDADEVGPMVVLRHWQPGDRFRPIGLGADVKLQDLFTNQKVPRPRRHQLVVAATAEGELFWVEGLRISERFKLSAQTARTLLWTWQRA